MKQRQIKPNIDALFESQNPEYPNRHRQIHKACCKNCPSANPDKCQEEKAEQEAILLLPKEFIAKEFAFLCAWRPDKLCKGFCDNMGIDQEFLNSIQ